MSDLSTKTNRALFHVQNLLGLQDLMAEMSSASGEKVVGFKESYVESTTAAVNALLKEAWLAWLNELGDLLKNKGGTFVGVTDFLQPPLNELPDVQPLINLNQQPHTWLSMLLDRIDPESNYVDASKLAQKASSTANSNAIDLISTDKPSEQDELKLILNEFKQHISHTRAQQVEW